MVCDISEHVDHCLPQNVHCPTCSMDFYSNYKNPWHSELSCEQNTRHLTKEGHAALMQSGSGIIKHCPMCNILTEKKEGCAVMYCRCCQHRFCWHCLASLKTYFPFRHHDKGPCKNETWSFSRYNYHLPSINNNTHDCIWDPAAGETPLLLLEKLCSLFLQMSCCPPMEVWGWKSPSRVPSVEAGTLQKTPSRRN